jgi:hypothetical protein
MAALLQLRPAFLRRGIAALMFLMLSPLDVLAASPATFLDAVLATVDGATITASDIALARTLSLFGFHPSDEPITKTDIEDSVDARLIQGEAVRLGIGDSTAEVDEAWQATGDRMGGMSALTSWLASTGIAEAWARQEVEADLRWRRFIQLRFRAFLFISEADVDKALGPGPHPAELRQRTREALTKEATDQEMARWLADARTRASIRYAISGEGTLPLPLPMPRTIERATDPPE